MKNVQVRIDSSVLSEVEETLISNLNIDLVFDVEYETELTPDDSLVLFIREATLVNGMDIDDLPIHVNEYIWDAVYNKIKRSI